jgi:pyridinium-3,5-biscarboxylic acid mononucleotide sulfurtransferase
MANITLQEKEELLRKTLLDLGSVLVAYSGGVDSTFLLKFAIDTLGPDKAAAVTAVSETYKPEDLESAKAIAKCIGARHMVVHSTEMDDPEYVANTPDRCYYCKKIRFSGLSGLLKELGIAHIVDGANMSDQGDYRPGERATKELGIRSPLREAGLYKKEIRELSRSAGLPNWDLPSQACLASRFPYGVALTPERLSQVYEAEKLIYGYGIGQARVRYHGDIARIEVPVENIFRLIDHRMEIVQKLKGLGFTYVTLDLQGFRSGSLNEALNKK